MREIIVEVALNGDKAPDVRVLRKRELFLELQERGWSDDDLEYLSIGLESGPVMAKKWSDLFWYQLTIPARTSSKNSIKTGKKKPL